MIPVEEIDEPEEEELVEEPPKKRIPPPYRRFRGFLAQGAARNPSDVLNDKLAYLEGRQIRPKEKRGQTRYTAQIDAFSKFYNPLYNVNEEPSYDVAYEELNSIFPDFASRNYAIMAAAYLIWKRMDLKGTLRVDEGLEIDVEDFDEQLRAVWTKLQLSFQQINQKTKKPTKHGGALAKVTIDKIKIDVFRYLRALVFYSL